MDELPYKIAWNRTFDGVGSDYGSCVAVASHGIYLAGKTSDPGDGDLNAFVAKYAFDGTQGWNRTWGGANDEDVSGLATATDGVYMVGDTKDFGAGGRDAFIIKYGTDGIIRWNHTWGGINDDHARGVAVAADGVYLVGYTYSFGVGLMDAFIVKYNAAGIQQWNHTWGGANVDAGNGVAVGIDGVYMAGETASSGAGSYDAFIAKYSATGSQLWNRTWGGIDSDYGNDIASCNNEIYLAGRTHSFGAGNYNAFIAKYNATGSQLWNRTWGGSDYDDGSSVAAIPGGVYLAGFTYSYGAGACDAFFTKYNAAGSQLWNRTWGDEFDDFGLDVAAVTDVVYLAGEKQVSGGSIYEAFLVKWVSQATDGDIPPGNTSVPGAPAWLVLTVVLVVLPVLVRRVVDRRPRAEVTG
ncbi:MAG: hypothetical protein Q6353_009645 [Candidatus Sigynarchaeum springense]